MANVIPAIDRELLLAHVLQKPREWVIAREMIPYIIPDIISVAQRRRYAVLLRRRARGEPLAYILGEQWFYGRPFYVNKDVLIPRPETEHLIVLALNQMQIANCKLQDRTIIDIGTGSGCLAVTLAAELPKARVIAIDSSLTALRIARTNARRHDVADRVTFVSGNLLEPFLKSSLRARTDISRAERGNPVVRTPQPGLLRRPAPRNDMELVVLANPPYLTTAEWRALPRSIRAYEPRAALDGGPDGLKYFRSLFQQLQSFVIRHSLFVILEIDPRRKRSLAALVRKTLPEWEASWHRDLAGRWRVLGLHGPTVTVPAGPRSEARSW